MKQNPGDVLYDDAVLYTVFFGANDASDFEKNRRQHVPLEEYKDNLKEIVKQISSKTERIIIIGAPPVDHQKRLDFQVQRYGDKATGELERTLELAEAYSNAAEEVSEELNLPFLDLWEKMQLEDVDNWARFLSDGLHFSPDGNRLVGKLLLQCIATSFPEICVTPCSVTGYPSNSSSKCDLKQVAPWHDELTPENAAQVFSSFKT